MALHRLPQFIHHACSILAGDACCRARPSSRFIHAMAVHSCRESALARGAMDLLGTLSMALHHLASRRACVGLLAAVWGRRRASCMRWLFFSRRVGSSWLTAPSAYSMRARRSASLATRLATRHACSFSFAACEAVVVHRACNDVASSAAESALAHGAIGMLDARSLGDIASAATRHACLCSLATCGAVVVHRATDDGTFCRGVSLGSRRHQRARCALDGIVSLTTRRACLARSCCVWSRRHASCK